ncbi:MAG: TonB-dependent receptor plug domain-containing protein [Bacteroidales bacterium]|nr:TonB-dependent receptor plug domain-containing protein [Bacteroidales bacterium]
MRQFIVMLMCLWVVGTSVMGQTQFTKEQVLSMSVDELSDLPLEDLMAAVEMLGVTSVDELFAMIMNKTVSSASKSEESAFTSPLASTMITKEEILQWGCNSIEEALRLVPGVMVSTKTNGNFDVQLRGLNNITDGQRLLYTENQCTRLLLDGRDLTDYVSGSMFMEYLPIGIEDIKCIEVVRGPVSALYGQNAVTGVINIITEKPGDKSDYMTSGTIQTSLDNGTTVASAATRMKMGKRVAGGVSINLETRKRTTTDVYVPGTKANYWYSPEWEALGYMEGPQGGTWEGKAEPFKGGWISLDKVGKLRTNEGTNENPVYYPVTFQQININELIPDPSMAKEQQAINGYLNVRGENSTFDFTVGYNKTNVNTSTLDECVFTLGGRKNQGIFFDINGKIKGLSLILNYDRHANDYCVGTPGYRVHVTRAGAIADYTFNLMDNKMQIRPSVEWTMYMSEDKEEDRLETINGVEYSMSSFWGGKVSTYTIAPAFKADYKTDNKWKFTAAARLDITTNPARENLNWQVEANKELNGSNFIRFSYGRATRAAVLTNTSVVYLMDRQSVSKPKYVHLEGSTHDLMYLDGFELGYRTRPTSTIMIDLEAYYSISKDYGALKAMSSYLTTTGDKFMQWMYGALSAYSTQGADGVAGYITNNWDQTYDTHSIYKYGNVPFKAKQMGVSANVDWIITPKLIMKANLNWQQTRVDNFYEYSQAGSVRSQLGNCVNDAKAAEEGRVNKSVAGFTSAILTGATTYATMEAMKNQYTQADPRFMASIVAYGQDCANAPAGLKTKYEGLLTEADYEKIHQAYLNGDQTYTGEKGTVINRSDFLGIYYGCKYDIAIDKNTGLFSIASTKQPSPILENNHKHKSTPSFYGSVGLIYKPTNIINVSALMSFMSKREFVTSYGSATQDAICNLNLKLGWTPNDHVEFFVQGHNLLNNDKQEFIYGDPVKAMLTTGMSCRF